MSEDDFFGGAFDAVVVGTGLVESMLSAGLAGRAASSSQSPAEDILRKG